MTTMDNKPKLYEDKPFFKLDNAANIYAFNGSNKWSRTFRLAVSLKEDIDPNILRVAAIETAKRFPAFCVRLRKGFFWNYLERVDTAPRVVEESDYPYRSLRLFDTNDCAFRVLYYKNRISVEVFHGITDGSGALSFVKTITARYIQLKHGVIGYDHQILNVADAPTDAENRDEYLHNADMSAAPNKFGQLPAYMFDEKTNNNYAKVTHGIIPADELKKAARDKGLTITEYLTAVHMYTAYKFANCNPKAPIRISVPANLRSRFESTCVRNFVYMSDVCFDCCGATDVSFDQICSGVAGILKSKVGSDQIKQAFSQNVTASENTFNKHVPYIIKNPVLHGNYKKMLNSYTMYFSNLGQVFFPLEIADYIDRVDFLLGVAPYGPYSCACATYGGLVNITISSTTKDNTRERFFFSFLASQGIRVRIECTDNYNGIGGDLK